MKVCAIILAAGQGERMKAPGNKLFIKLKEPILYHTVDIFEKSASIDSIIIVAHALEIEQASNIASHFKKVIKVVEGGSTRQQSSYNGVLAANGYDIVVLHDGARPFTRDEVVTNSVTEAMRHGASVVAVPEKNTIKEVNSDGFIHRTLERRKLWSIQTPQVFHYDILLKAHKWAEINTICNAVDDALLVEMADASIRIKIIEGDYDNIKITTRDDLSFARGIFEKTMNDRAGVRIGFGVDSHAFDSEDKDLVLGGLKITGYPGLKANSDGDVVFHALFNAVSQALGMGSIGLYADTMCLSEGIRDSAHYLCFISSEMAQRGYRINNIGIMIEAKKPRIEPFVDGMKSRISGIFSITEDQIGICATSGEDLDAFGKGRGIKCSCMVSLVNENP
ncbi:MAG: 2-C-methyl-D-erythritol 4-phosphate cytidylyltransferase [bacterium]